MVNHANIQDSQVKILEQKNDPEQEKRVIRAHYLEWLKGQDVGADALSTYRMLIRRCDDFVTRSHISSNGVLLEDDIAALEACYVNLKKSLSFRAQPNSNSMLTALARYIAFRETDTSKNKYMLKAFGEEYIGATPAHVLSQFISAFTLWYPTSLHRMINRSWKSKTFVSNARKSIRDYQIGKNTAFLTHNIALDDAIEFANWLCKEFGVDSGVKIVELPLDPIAEEKNDLNGAAPDVSPTVAPENSNVVVPDPGNNGTIKGPRDIQAVLIAYEQWLISQKALSQKSAMVYRQALKALPTIVDRNDIDLALLCASGPTIEAALNRCLESAEFGRGRASQFRCSVMAYLEFLGQYDTGSDDPIDVTLSDGAEADSAAYTEEAARIIDILSLKFSNGIRKESFIDLRKFRKAWVESVGTEYTKSDNDLKEAVASVCIDTGERWYLPTTLLSPDDKEMLDKELMHFFDGTHHVLYISQLYDSVQNQLSNNLVTSELFGVVLRRQYRRKYYFSREVIADAANVRLDIGKEIENELVSAGHPVAVRILQERLWYIPAARIEKELKNSSHFIRNTRDKETGGEFFHDSMLRFAEAEAQEIVDIMSGCILRDDYALRGDVLKRISARLPEVAERMAGYSDYGIWEALRRRLVKRFSFTDTVACKLGVCLTNTDLLTMFCKNHTPFTWDEYKDFAREIGGQQSSRIAQQNAFRINQNQYISKNDIAFQVEQVDDAISIYFTPDVTPVENILSFDAFPSCGYPWNHYLLEQYVWERSQKYCLDGGGNYGLSGKIRLR